MDYRRGHGRNEINTHPRHVQGCQLEKMSFNQEVDPVGCCNPQSGGRRPLKDHRRNVFHLHSNKVRRGGPMSHCTASTASLSDSEFGGDFTDLRRVYLAEEGESIESISLVEDEYWRLNYVSMKDDKSSGTASTKSSTPTYYRPVDSFEQKSSSNICAASLRLPPPAVSALTTNHSDEMSALTFNCSLSEDGPCTSGTARKTKTRNPQRKIEKTISWTDDDSEIKRMESITHSFQRSSSMTSSYHKISAPPLSGIGVEVGRSASFQHDHIHTPRAAANVSCSLPSIMGELLGLAQPRDGVKSSRKGLFSGFKTILCNSDIGHNTSVIPTKSKYDSDDWSFDANSQVEELAFDPDDTGESLIGGDDLRNGGYAGGHRTRPPQSTQCRRKTPRINTSVADPSPRHRATKFSRNNGENDDTHNKSYHQVHRRKYQDTPHFRRTSN